MAQTTYMEMLMKQLAERPDSLAFRDTEHPQGITYREVDDRSGRVYAWLKAKGIGREQTVLINLPRGADAFMAVIGVLRAGAAYTLTEAGYPKERVDFIAKDCGCVLRIDADLYTEMQACAPAAGYEPADEHDAAYAVYTSGTTGTPKGVLHERGQLTLFMNSINDHGEPFCVADDRFMLLSPLNFVASTLLMLMTSGNGAEMTIVDYDTVRNPARLLAYMKENRITGGFMTPSLVRAFAGGQDTVGEHHPFNPEFRVLFLSSEPARNIWYRDLTIYNVFGQSEMGFLGGVFRVDKPWEVTPVGQSMIPGYHLCLRDVSAGMGEVCIENPYFRGYINLPEMTEYVLRDGIYHSGDIGKMAGDSDDIILLGRNDDMVKINGNRVEPAEIEAMAKQVLGVNWCAAKAFVKPDRAYVCVYYQDDIQIDEETAIRQMAEKLPAYMVPACFVKIDRIPVNANGKMNRKALPEPEILAQETAYIPPETEREQQICDAFARVLGLSRVSVTDDFYRIGGDSLKTIRLMTEPGMEGISATDVFRERTARALASMAEKTETPEQIREREEKARRRAYPLTAMQQNFYDIQARKPDSPMWALPLLYAFPPETETRLKAAVEAVMANHPIFRTVLKEGRDGKIMQEYREMQLPVGVEDRTEEEIREICETLKDPDLPFRMLEHPLVKIRLIRTEKRMYLFLLAHHIMTDGCGLQAVLKSLRSAFREEKLTPDSYYSWLERETETAGSPARQEARQKIEELYTGTEWTGQMCSDGRPSGNENGVIARFVPITEEAMLALEQETGLSRTGLFATVLLLALARHTGKKDILINWVYSNRGDAILDGISGMILKSLALGIRFDRFETLGDVYREVKEQMLLNISSCAYEWCLHHPMDEADDRLFFVFEGAISNFDVLKEIGAEPVPVTMKNQAVVHPMSAQVLDWVTENQKGMLLVCYYNLNMFEPDEVKRFETILGETAELVLRAPDSRERSVKSVINARR